MSHSTCDKSERIYNSESTSIMNCPLDLEEICRSGSFINQHFEHSFSKHFAFEAYVTLVEGGSLPDLESRLLNGSLCENYVRNFLAFVSVSSPTASVIKTVRDKRFTFHDKLARVGGTLGLFTGMSLLSMVEVSIFAFVLVKCIIQEVIHIFVNPSSIKSYFISKKKNKRDNEEQMKCHWHKGCKQQLDILDVSLSKSFLSLC